MNRVRTEFGFQLEAPFAAVFPLFGAHEERRWAAGWSPRIVHPDPAADVEGAVFVVGDADQSAVWVNTRFDVAKGRVQYVNFAGPIVTRIDITIAGGRDATAVGVVYERTALSPAAAGRLEDLADGDRRKGPEWAAAIRACLTHAAPP